MSEPLKARITQTANGQAPTPRQLKDYLGPNSHRADDDDPTWFWVFATPRAAANIRACGHYARGTLLTTYYPPQRLECEVSELPEPDAADVANSGGLVDHPGIGVVVYDHGRGEWVRPADAQHLRVEAS